MRPLLFALVILCGCSGGGLTPPTLPSIPTPNDQITINPPQTLATPDPPDPTPSPSPSPSPSDAPFSGVF